jgi:hypothetical protein
MIDVEISGMEIIEAASHRLDEAIDELAEGFYAARKPGDRAVLNVVDALRAARKQLAWLQRYHGEEFR